MCPSQELSQTVYTTLFIDIPVTLALVPLFMYRFWVFQNLAVFDPCGLTMFLIFNVYQCSILKVLQNVSLNIRVDLSSGFRCHKTHRNSR